MIHLKDIAIDSKDSIHAVDSINSVIKKFDRDNELLKSWPIDEKTIISPYGPTGKVIDNKNDIYVINSTNDGINKFDSTGTLVTTIDHLRDNKL